MVSNYRVRLCKVYNQVLFPLAVNFTTKSAVFVNSRVLLVLQRSKRWPLNNHVALVDATLLGVMHLSVLSISRRHLNLFTNGNLKYMRRPFLPFSAASFHSMLCTSLKYHPEHLHGA